MHYQNPSCAAACIDLDIGKCHMTHVKNCAALGFSIIAESDDVVPINECIHSV